MLPNDVTSNFVPFAVIVATTVLVFRAKVSLCDSYRRMPVQIRMDLMLLIACNLLAFSLIVMWAYSLTADYEALLSFDLIFGMLLQRRMLQLVHKYDTAPYHEPGPLALAQRKRRCKLAVMTTSLIAAFAAACVASLAAAAQQDNLTGTNQDYWTDVALLPCIYAAARTLAFDWQGCRATNTTTQMVLGDDGPTNAFTITDDDDEDDSHSVTPGNEGEETSAL
jgi:hypothetical protein